MYMTGLTCMVLTPRFQRLGDLAAGTMVIVEESRLGSKMPRVEEGEIADLLVATNGALRTGDYSLVGIDLDKDSAMLEAAYNNQTAIMTNLCVLQHLNWRFGGDFDIFRFPSRPTKIGMVNATCEGWPYSR